MVRRAMGAAPGEGPIEAAAPVAADRAKEAATPDLDRDVPAVRAVRAGGPVLPAPVVHAPAPREVAPVGALAAVGLPAADPGAVAWHRRFRVAGPSGARPGRVRGVQGEASGVDGAFLVSNGPTVEGAAKDARHGVVEVEQAKGAARRAPHRERGGARGQGEAADGRGKTVTPREVEWPR